MKGVRQSMTALSAITMLCAGLIAVLFFASNEIADSQNGFMRKFPPHLAVPIATLDLGYTSYYAAGGDDQGFYLANYTAPLQMVRLSYTLDDTMHFKLKVPDKIMVEPGSVRIRVDSPYVYFSEGKQPFILYGTIDHFNIDKTQDTSVFFLNAEPVSPYSSIGTVYDRHQRKTMISRKTARHDIALAPDVLNKQLDGLFCMDGILNYNRKTAALVYVYFYRNQFVRLDTSLNVVYRGRTIDTTAHVRLAVDTLSMSQEVTFSKPPFVVNRKSCISEKWLFVHSALRANNEDESLLEDTYPIDVYNLDTGGYEFSFYVPVFRKKKISSMRVFGKSLVVMTDEFVHVFRLNF